MTIIKDAFHVFLLDLVADITIGLICVVGLVLFAVDKLEESPDPARVGRPR